MSSDGPRNFTIFESIGPGVTPWLTPENAETEDGTTAFVAFVAFPPDSISELLRASAPEGQAPPGATMESALVEVKRSRNAGAPASIRDSDAYALKGGVRSGANLADLVTEWPTTAGWASYLCDLTGWTVDEANALGFELSVLSGVGGEIAHVDHVQVTFTFTPADDSPVLMAGVLGETGDGVLSAPE